MTPALERYRRSPRPSYFSASTGVASQISFDFETWLLGTSNNDKQALITRLQKSMGNARVNGPRDNLLSIALDFQAMNAGAAEQELGVTLQELSDTVSELVEGTEDVEEISLMFADIGRSYGESTFRRKLEQNTVTAAAFLQAQVGSGIGSGTTPGLKKQLASWITVVAAYIVPGQ